MSYFILFALLGASPGIILNIYNMYRRFYSYKKIRSLDPSWSGSLTVNLSSQSKFLANPGSYINPDDSASLKEEKENFINGQSRYIRRHIIGAFLMIVGGFCGAAFSALTGVA